MKRGICFALLAISLSSCCTSWLKYDYRLQLSSNRDRSRTPGIWIESNGDDGTFEICKYGKDSTRHGKCKEYLAGGLNKVTTYKHGIKEGPQKLYRSHRKVQIILYYSNDTVVDSKVLRGIGKGWK